MAKPKSRLGRGLGGLISGGGSVGQVSAKLTPEKAIPKSRTTKKPSREKKGSSTSTDELMEIATSEVVPNPYQPRKSMDSEAIGELAASIKAEGLLQPIVVRKSGEVFELVAGERRWRAHQKLGRKKVLARILQATDLSSASLSLIENLQREGLNPIEEALGYHSLVNDFNLTQAKVAERVGKSRVHITNLLRLLKLHEELRVLLSEGKLSTGHAKVLLGIEDLNDQLKIGKQAIAEGWTVRHCEKEVYSFLNPSSSNHSKIPGYANPFSGMAQKAESKLGRSVKIKGEPSGGGKMTLGFEDPVDLQNLLTSLGL